MPRIVPIQLLKCLKVLLDDNGGILSAGEVKRLASLMTKYSKKLVSKCIYVQILKCTQTELLGEFMGAGGWSLVYTWLNDAIRAMNWPLVQEILELLLLCPVDVNRLKINSAPKLVKGLCKDGGNEGVRILAKRLVEQWLKVVTENPEATLPTSSMTPQATVIKTPTVAVVAPEAISVNVQQQQTSVVNSTNQNTSNAPQKLQQKQEEQKMTDQQKLKSNKKTNKVQEFEQEEEAEEEEDEEEEENSKDNEPIDQDPLGGVDPEPVVTNYTLTPAQKKASESGLVYKFIIKDGQSILAKVPPKTKPIPAPQPQSSVEEQEEEEAESNEVVNDDVEPDDETETPKVTVDNSTAEAEVNENSSSLDKTDKDNESNSGSEDKIKIKDTKKLEDKKSLEDKEKSSSKKDHQSSKDKERRGSSSSLEKDKEKDKEKDSKSLKSSSSSHRSSSSHKSTSSSSSKSSSSSSSKLKSSSSSSSSSHRSSTDKHRSDKERSSSSKDKNKDRSSSSSSKHRSSSSSKSSSSSSSSKDKYKDKEKTSSSSSKSKDKQEQSQSDKDKDTFEKITSSPSLDKLCKIPKKSKEEELGVGNDIAESSNKSTSITIPSKKASMSIEIRKDTEKAKTVKTYKSQFRSHGLTEEAPPPPSRKGLKKPSSVTPPGTVLPSSLPSSLKRTSPPPRDSPSEKKAKIDINNVSVANEKPGSIKLIPPKKIQTLVETNLFSDALSAATGPKKVTKRKRPNTTLVNGKESPASPISPDASKVMPLKFYQDTLDESKSEDSKSNKDNDEAVITKTPEEEATTDDKDIEDDDDIPLKKVKEDIEQKVAKEKKLDGGNTDVKTIDITKDAEEEQQKDEGGSSPSRQQQLGGSPKVDDEVEIVAERKPGPGCGPNGPPGVLMLHRRKGPKKKLSWCPQDTLEQIRYFELDETERCNVTKTSFMDMKNMERFSERDAIVMARRGFNQEDNMEAQTLWKPLIEVDDVPPHPEGNQSKQRKIQAERELTTLRALYFSHALIPDSPAEADFEPAFNHDVPLIPLDDLTGNPDAVNDFTSMPWPEPRGSPKQGDNSMSGTGGLGSPVNMFGSPSTQVINAPNNNKQGSASQFNPFVNPFVVKQGPNGPNVPPIQNSPQNQWQGPGSSMVGSMGGNGPMMGNPFNGNHGSPLMDIGGPGPMGPGPMMNNGPPQNFMNQFSPNFGGPPNPFMGGPSGFNNGPNNFGPMGPNGPMVNGMGPGPMGNNCPPQMMNSGHINRNNRNMNGGNWRSGGSNFQDNSGGGGNWRPAGPGPNIRGGGGGGNNGVCKAFMRGHCRLGNSCKYIHPNKSKRI